MSSTKQIQIAGTKSYKVWKKEKEEMYEDIGIGNIFKKKTESEMKSLYLYYQKKQAHILKMRRKYKFIEAYYTPTKDRKVSNKYWEETHKIIITQQKKK